MLRLSVLSRLMLAILLLALSENIHTAPTHHLTIGVQGNIPTLTVTSSEIGITTQTLNLNKKPAKVLYAAKAFKDSETSKKPMKTKLNKNLSSINKKDKLLYFSKPQFKPELKEENTDNANKSWEQKTTEIETAKEKVSLNTNEEIINLITTAASMAEPTSPKNANIYKTNTQSSTLPPTQLNEMPLLSTIKTQTTTKSLEVISTLLTPATTDTSSIHFAITDNDDLNIASAASTTLSPKDLTTLNNNDDTNTAATKHTLITNVVSQTHKTAQISTETSINKIANEDDSDRYTQQSISTTDNENVLLTTKETEAVKTPAPAAEISATSTATSETDNADAATTKEMLLLSLITTTTENVADNNSQGEEVEYEQQQPTAAEKSHQNRNVPVESTTTPGEGKVKEADNPIKLEYQRDNFANATLEPQQYTDEFKSIENPFKKPTEQSTPQESASNAAKESLTENMTKATITSKQHLTTTENEQPALGIYKTNPEPYATSAATEISGPTIEPATKPTTIETILKLIDLEKPVLKTMAELKQPSTVMVAQHDNGHDGLKTTKKKQLVDKHYVEALLHHKQDAQSHDFKEPLSTNSTHSPLRGHIPLLKTIEHGSLGPILMQEKTFHVMHQNDSAHHVKQHSKDDVISQLRKGHFVELKAQPAANENKKNKDILASAALGSGRNEKEEIEMQSDQPAENFNQQNMEQAKEYNNKQNSRDIATQKYSILVRDKSKSLKNTRNEAKNMLQREEFGQELQRSEPIPKAVDTPKSSETKLKLLVNTSTPQGIKTNFSQYKHAKETNMKLPQPAFENKQQLVKQSLPVITSNAENIKLDQNSSQQISKAKETSGEKYQEKISEISSETNKNLSQQKTSKVIQKSNIFKNSEISSQASSSERHQQPEPEGSTEYNSESMLNTAANDDLAKSTPENRDTNKTFAKELQLSPYQKLQPSEEKAKPASVLSTTVFQVSDSATTKTPMMQAETLFTAQTKEKTQTPAVGQQIESKISDIQIEIYDSTIDSIVASTNFKDSETKQHNPQQSDENYLGKTTRPPLAALQQERFTQYVIDRTETSTHEPINYNTIKVAAGKPEPAAIEIHINVSESFGNESEDLEFSYPQTEIGNSQQNEKAGEVSYDESKVSDNIKLKIPSNLNSNVKDTANDEILVVEIIDTENNTSDASQAGKSKIADELFITDVKHEYTTPPPPPPPPPYQTSFDRDSDTIFYISNTEVKVGESLASPKNTNEERKLKLESQFFPANYMASTHPNVNNNEDTNPHPNHHLYEEDIILSSNRNQADSLKIYRNNNEPSPPLDVTYVGESIIEVEQSPDAVATTTYAPDQMHNVATPQADVIIQPAILPEISIGVPVIGELPPQIELKEIDFMPNEAQLRRSGIYDDNDNSNNNDLDDNTITGSSSSNNNNNNDVDIVSGNSNSNQHIDESSIQYGGDLIDESADGGFDGVEGSYPFGNPALVKKSFLSSPFSSSSATSTSYSTAFLTKLQKQQRQQQPNHVADYAHLYVNYGVNNMRKDELTADVKDSGEMYLNANVGNGNVNVASNEQNSTSFKDFLSKVSMSNATMPFAPANATQTERMSNATAFSVMEDVNDLEDKNTENIINLISLAIGLFIVILPVVVTCSMFWALRYLYKKYHSNLTDNPGYGDPNERKIPLTEDGAEKGEFVHVTTSSSPTNSHKDMIEKYPDTSNKPSTTNSSVKFSSEKPIPNIQTSSSNTNASLAANYPCAIVSQKAEALRLSLALSSPITQNYAKPLPTASSPLSKSAASEQTHYERDDIFSEERDDDDVEMPGPNGSITKMTLENNLLIVETEERNDISRVARETKMDYNKDGVFVVEVARGIDSKTIPESPVAEGNEKLLSMFDTKQNNGGLGYKITNEKNCSNNERVQIHSPPPESHEEGPRSLHQIEEVEEPINSPHLNENPEEGNGLAYKANTGLSQSDLSTTSSSDSNKGYCYGNQELYVVEQKGYSPVTRNGNVALKCDIKDLKDDDRNPGNDHYLKHSPNKKEDLNKDKEDAVETTRKSQEKQNRTSSGESPEQKQNDQMQGRNENNSSTIILEKQGCKLNPLESKNTEKSLEENQGKVGTDLLCKKTDKTADIPIPVEIEVHIIPAPVDDLTEDETLPSYQTAMEQEISIKEQPNFVSQPLTPKDVHDVLSEAPEDVLLAHQVNGNCTPTEINLITTAMDSDNKIEEDKAGLNIKEDEGDEICENLNPELKDITNENSVTEATNEQREEKQSQNDEEETQSKEEYFESSVNSLEQEKKGLENREETETTKKAQVIGDTNDQFEETKNHNGGKVPEIKSLQRPLISLEINGVAENEEPQQLDIADVNGLIANHTENENLSNELTKEVYREEMETILAKAATTVEHTQTEPRLQELPNGHADPESENDSLNEIENGYDSIISLPEPPPTTEEQLNSDLSEQQLDSLPPPPPPEVFSLKDLPPPLTNGNVDSPQSEESNSFYQTLPPPPPTTLEVTASAETTTTTNGKVHASPLTPPASPPAHFTNNLHVSLCSQPIAVDVNGS